MPFALIVFAIKAEVFYHFKSLVADLNRLEGMFLIIQETLVIEFKNLCTHSVAHKPVNGDNISVNQITLCFSNTEFSIILNNNIIKNASFSYEQIPVSKMFSGLTPS